MAGVVRRWQLMRIRSRLALIAAVVLVGAYGWLAIYTQPVISGSDEMLKRAPGQNTLSDPFATGCGGPCHEDHPPRLVVDYVDGGVATLVKTLFNNGQVPVVITGVEPSPPYLLALVTVEDARSAVVVGAAPCCELNQKATWSGNDFRPIRVDPGQQGVVAVHLLMSHCEDNGSGGYEIIDSLKVDYWTLGFPHTQDVIVGPYWFQSPDTCPRTGPARP